MAKLISARELGRKVNMSNTSVSKAIKAGKLTDCYDPVLKKFDWAKAKNNDWVISASVIKKQGGMNTAKVIDKMDAAEKGHNQQIVKVPKNTNPRIVANDSKELPKGLPEWDGVDIETLDENQLADGLQLTAGMDVREAMRYKEIIEAAISKIKLKQLQSSLVLKSEVDKALFAFGISFKRALLQIPNNVTDEVLSANNKIEAMNIIRKSIVSVLEEYSDTAALDTIN